MTDLSLAIDIDDEDEENAIDATPEGVTKQKRSLRRAVNEYCRSCIYDPLDKGAGNWRQQVANCTVAKCALYEVRPFSKPKKTSNLPVD